MILHIPSFTVKEIVTAIYSVIQLPFGSAVKTWYIRQSEGVFGELPAVPIPIGNTRGSTVSLVVALRSLVPSQDPLRDGKESKRHATMSKDSVSFSPPPVLFRGAGERPDHFANMYSTKA
ncbi:hypothetical protein RRG08_009974 [Elysia crispata]|uniref:Uncharacterized protein n=1 Tax=Elysia crispata TaxID=231223 RepID=A0AAE1B5Q7_9GAST|nr:hypothetical protein RRG08_009974 [Elysia crispata]